MRATGTSIVLFAAAALPAYTVDAAELFESFESGFGAWSVDAHIASVPPDQFIYSVTRSQTQAEDGSWSLEFYIDGSHDDGSVWIVRSVDVPAGSWLLAVNFNVWEPFDSEINIWPRIAFIDTFQPQVEADFARIVPPSVSAGWTPFTYTRAMNFSSQQQVWVAVGLAVTWETPRTNYIDSVTVSWTPFPCNNGTCDFGENPCNCPADCPGAESPEVTCDDGLDNDCDSLTDCADPDCASVFACACGDGVCEAPEDLCNCPADCPGAESPEATCDDGIDNDCNGYTDCDDIACSAKIVCIPTVGAWGMFGTALLLVIAATLILRRDRARAPQATWK